MPPALCLHQTTLGTTTSRTRGSLAVIGFVELSIVLGHARFLNNFSDLNRSISCRRRAEKSEDSRAIALACNADRQIGREPS